ncbi:uncharacterized protein [Porites lutea]|uniref:uncharacterized protein isoform X2 n=1 Tax=Porites lutea TaxID=51062 RepID=UPI003CC62CB4
MLSVRLILILAFILLASGRPSPELSLEEIEKELQQLSAHVSDDATDITSKSVNDQTKSTKEDVSKKTETEVPKELTSKTREVPKENLKTLAKTLTKTEQKKDATKETTSDNKDKKTTDTSADSVVRLPLQTKQDFRDSAAYRRLMELDAANSHYQKPPILRKPVFPEAPFKRTHGYPEVPRKYASYGFEKFDKPLQTKSRYYDIPARRTYDDSQARRRNFLPHSDPMELLKRLSADHTVSDTNRQGFLPNPNPNVNLRGLPSDMTRAERVSSWSGGSWFPDSKPVKISAQLPPPDLPDVTSRSFNVVHKQSSDTELEDLIHGKEGITDLEKRKRYLMDQLAEKIKLKVAEAHKRGIKIPDKIMDFLWDYESQRGGEARM